MMKRTCLFAALIGLTIGGIACDRLSQQSHPTRAAESQSQSQAQSQDIVRFNAVRSLPGGLDTVPMFNSNSPEWIKTEGILLSTFPPNGKQVPAAHLDFAFEGPFTLFAHHFTHTPPNLQTLYLGILVHNPGSEPVQLSVPAAASYLMDPEAPFQQQPAMSETPNGEVYSGPGIRAVDNVLRGQRQADFPATLTIPAGESRMLMNHPIPVKGLERPVNGRSSFFRLASDRPVYVASLAQYAKKNGEGGDRAPTLQEWQQLLETGGLAGPRDKTPTPPDQTSGQLIYGRVAGVQQGSRWQAILTDPDSETLAVPQPGEAISYVVNTLRGGRLGTESGQAAPLLVRYPDTAYASQANYAVHYDLTLPLVNTTDQPQTVVLRLETPKKEDRLSRGGLIFRQPSWDFPFFRGTVRLRYGAPQSNTQSNPQDGTLGDSDQAATSQAAQDTVQTRYVHLWHRMGQVLDPLAQFELAPGAARSVRVDFLYPPDSVPPQVLTVETLEPSTRTTSK